MPQSHNFVRVYPRLFQGRRRARHLRRKNWRRSSVGKFDRRDTLVTLWHYGRFSPVSLVACVTAHVLPAGMERGRRELAGAQAGNRSIKALLDATERVSNGSAYIRHLTHTTAPPTSPAKARAGGKAHATNKGHQKASEPLSDATCGSLSLAAEGRVRRFNRGMLVKIARSRQNASPIADTNPRFRPPHAIRSSLACSPGSALIRTVSDGAVQVE